MLFVVICSVGILFVLLALPLAFRRKRPLVVRDRLHASFNQEDFKQPERDEPPPPLPLIPNDEIEYEVMVYRWRANPDKYPYPMPPPHVDEQNCD